MHLTVGSTAIEYVLWFWIKDAATGPTAVRSAVMIALWDTFEREGVKLPIPGPARVIVEQAANHYCTLHSMRLPARRSVARSPLIQTVMPSLRYRVPVTDTDFGSAATCRRSAGRRPWCRRNSASSKCVPPAHS